MFRIFTLILAGVVFLGAFGAMRTAPKWTGSPADIGYYTAIAIALSLGVFFLALPNLVAWFFSRRGANLVDEAAEYTGGWQPTGGQPVVGSTPAENGPSPYAVPLFLAIMLALLAVPFFFWRKPYDGVRGPRPIDSADLAGTAHCDDLPTRWVVVKPDAVLDAGVTSQKKSKWAPPVTVHHVLLKVGDKYLVAHYPELRIAKHTGYLSPFSAKEPWNKSSAPNQELARKYPQLVKDVLPFELTCEAESDTRLACFGLAGLCLFFGLASGFLALTCTWDRKPKDNAAERVSAPAAAPAYVSPFGRRGAPADPLGTLVSTHRSTGVRLGTIGFFVSAAMLIGLAGLFAFPMLQKIDGVPVEMWTLPGLPAFFGMCCLVAGAMSNKPRPTFHLFTGGMRVESASGPVSFTWAEVRDYRQPRTPRNDTWSFDLHDGRGVTFHGAVTGIEGFLQSFWNEHGVPDLVEKRVREIQAGEVIRVGDFEISRDAISLGKQMVPWGEIKSAVVQVFTRSGARYLRVDVAGRMFTWQSRNLSTMRSCEVFLRVLERAAPRRIWAR